MNVSEFYSKLEKLLVKHGKGDKEITLSIGGISIPFDNIVWHEECGEFHVMPTAPTEEEIKEVNSSIDRLMNEIDKQLKRGLN